MISNNVYFYFIAFLNALYRGLISFTPLVLFRVLGAITIGSLARKKSWRELPKVANQFSLNSELSRNHSEFGKISGKIKGYEVVVTPDANIKIKVYFKSEYEIDISTSKPKFRPSLNETVFKTSNWKFNKIFKSRQAEKDLAQRFDLFKVLMNDLMKFRMKWIWHLDSISIEKSYISCGFNYGDPFYLYLPAHVLQDILPEIIEIAQNIDKTLGDLVKQ